VGRENCREKTLLIAPRKNTRCGTTVDIRMMDTNREPPMLRILVIAFVLAIAGTAAAQDAATLEKGKQVYSAQKCQVCHSIAGVGNKRGALDEVGSKLKPEEIRQWIVAAPEMTAKAKAERKPPMKSYTLPKDELDALVAYLTTLKKKA
jgi:mono/diheme cytochrome c family protein